MARKGKGGTGHQGSGDPRSDREAARRDMHAAFRDLERAAQNFADRMRARREGSIEDRVERRAIVSADPYATGTRPEDGFERTYYQVASNPRWNEGENKALVTASWLYRAADSEKWIGQLRNFFSADGLATGTIVRFDPMIFQDQDEHSIDGRVIQNFANGTFGQIEGRCRVPVYQGGALRDFFTDSAHYGFGVSLDRALQTSEGENYLRAVFDTTDDKKIITKKLAALSGMNSDRINLLTPEARSRTEAPIRLVRFFYGVGYYNEPRFYVSAMDTPERSLSKALLVPIETRDLPTDNDGPKGRPNLYLVKK